MGKAKAGKAKKFLVKKFCNCPRCLGTHRNLEFKPLPTPGTKNGASFYYWAVCPKTVSPIIATRAVKSLAEILMEESARQMSEEIDRDVIASLFAASGKR